MFFPHLFQPRLQLTLNSYHDYTPHFVNLMNGDSPLILTIFLKTKSFLPVKQVEKRIDHHLIDWLQPSS